MGRLDTAGFFKNLLFHGHSKTKLVVGGDDIGPVVNPDIPIDPCGGVPTGYECIGGEWLPRVRGKKGIDPIPIPPEAPEEETECRKFTSRGAGIKATPSGVFSGADANSGGQWTFRCYNSVTFYGRLNKSNPLHQQVYLVNGIRRGVGNYVRELVVPEGSIDEQSIFKFEVYADGKYTISIKRKTSGDLYYDWKVYQQGILEEADGETLYVGVSALAEIWSVTAESTDEIYVMEHTALIMNIHNVTKKEITISDDRGQSVTLMDRNIGATAYYLEEGKTSSDWKGYLYQWGNNYPFTRDTPERETQQVDGSIYGPNNPYSNSKLFVGNNDTGWQWWIGKTTWYPNMWGGESNSDIDKRGPCPEGYHIPTTEELMKVRNMLFRAHSSILYGSDIAIMLRMPYTGRRNNGTASVDQEYAGYYRACNVPEQTGNVKANYFSFNVTLSQADGGINRTYPGASYAIRPFKNVTDVPKYTIRFLNFDGTVLQSSIVVAGSTPEYTGSIPTKPGDQQYVYTFDGWDSPIVAATENKDYTATYVEKTILYSGNGGQILHNISGQEITLIKANGEELTIMDRNLGATAYRGESGASAADTYGNFYQWGNNYGFPNSGTITKSDVQVDASGNSWQNPINSSTFIYGNSNWMNPSNGELWGKTEGTEISRQGPCPNGWHVPSKAEMDKLLSMYQSITGIGSSGGYVKLEQYLLFTYPGYRRYTNGDVSYQGQSYNGVHLLTNDMNQQLYYGSSWWYYNTNGVGCGNPIRPFKNVT